MMLKFLGIDFDILEASDHVGGRCATHSFVGVGPDCAHDYYDMGAMRVPNIGSMKSTLNLIKSPSLLNIPDSLVEYVYTVYTVDSQGNPTYHEPFCYCASKCENAIKDVLKELQSVVQIYFAKG
ncbi:hypothetical protein QC761_0092520 [Podospora bellae-mahoneyi]|uniref:Amine oxidase domain-containing protein n=1 Tax=Podospora bellae-mahoneyi TaxID=2093777 RepID=A0ABR0FBV4_9PEZI|nr:hypothetical protein QC761_0092520 [Podospora bellae-mahoneyi]